MSDARAIEFPWRCSADQGAAVPAHQAVVIVGAGPVGLVAALGLARRGHRVVVIDRKRTLSEGSKAICWSKRTLEIMDRLGLAQPLVERGVTWQRGRVFFGEREVYAFDLLPEEGYRWPAFINLQQYLFEACCIAAAAKDERIDLRWRERVTGIAQTGDGLLLQVETPEGRYRILADWVIAADGAHSTLRPLMRLGFEGRSFQDQFLICDIKMRAERPTERWFWFDPPFNRGYSALLHKQADDVWRLDFQVGDTADRDEEVKPENAARRVRAMLGENTEFSFEWISLYRFHSRRLARFRHGRVLFAGDAAHQMSPFGARGGNSGIEDADNLVWKLDLVLRGMAPEALLESYDSERTHAADENLRITSRTADFISPKGEASRAFRDATLALAETELFARRLINSGRLSTPACYDGSPLGGPDGFAPGEAPATRPGAAAPDAPLRTGWLLDRLGRGFAGVWLGRGIAPADATRVAAELEAGGLPSSSVALEEETACRRYGAERMPALYLIRPDGHVAARWRTVAPGDVAAALAVASGRAAPSYATAQP
jgi:3-(3-hydroxy-phenyl)propionate hydroxylase